MLDPRKPSKAKDGGGGASAEAAPVDRELGSRVDLLLERIRPAVREDGGDLQLISVHSDGLVRIRLLGACVGCPSAHQTLHHGIERTLRAELGTSIRVEAVE